MAKLVSVCEPEDSHDFQRRQVPIEVDAMKVKV